MLCFCNCIFLEPQLNSATRIHASADFPCILQHEGIRVAVLTSDVKPELREAWYERQSRQGVQVVIGHPKLCCLGLDLLEYPDLFFWETGYSLYTLRQASRRSWRIGQRDEVRVKYFAYANTAQETCLEPVT